MELKYKNYTIKTLDKLNITIIEKRRTDKRKKFTKNEFCEVRLGYYSSIEDALLALIDKALIEVNNNNDITILLNEIKELKEFVKGVKEQNE